MLIDNKGINKVSHVLIRTSAELSALLGRPVTATFEFTDVEVVNQTKIIQVVMQVTGVPFDELTSATRTNRIVFARYHCFELMRKYLGATLVHIGRTFDKDHSTVVTGLRTFKNLYAMDTGFREQYNLIEHKLLNNEDYD